MVERQNTFEGKHCQYRKVTISPRPKQISLPCWIGGSARAASERTVHYGTGWQAPYKLPEEAGKIILHYAKEQGQHMDPLIT